MPRMLLTELAFSSGARILMAALALIAFYLVGFVFLQSFSLDLGSLNNLASRYRSLVQLWLAFGGVSAALLALAVSQGSHVRTERLTTRLAAVSERRFLALTCVCAFMIPLCFRVFLLRGAPLADDEGAYRFGAELLASGRLWVASPAMKLFFDQNFMINDGRLYPAYFLGWPAILAIGVTVSAPELMNPLLSALTVPALYGVLQHFVSRLWARAGILLFLSSPFSSDRSRNGAVTYLLLHGPRVVSVSVPVPAYRASQSGPSLSCWFCRFARICILHSSAYGCRTWPTAARRLGDAAA